MIVISRSVFPRRRIPIPNSNELDIINKMAFLLQVWVAESLADLLPDCQRPNQGLAQVIKIFDLTARDSGVSNTSSLALALTLTLALAPSGTLLAEEVINLLLVDLIHGEPDLKPASPLLPLLPDIAEEVLDEEEDEPNGVGFIPAHTVGFPRFRRTVEDYGRVGAREEVLRKSRDT